MQDVALSAGRICARWMEHTNRDPLAVANVRRGEVEFLAGMHRLIHHLPLELDPLGSVAIIRRKMRSAEQLCAPENHPGLRACAVHGKGVRA